MQSLLKEIRHTKGSEEAFVGSREEVQMQCLLKDVLQAGEYGEA